MGLLGSLDRMGGFTRGKWIQMGSLTDGVFLIIVGEGIHWGGGRMGSDKEILKKFYQMGL